MVMIFYYPDADKGVESELFFKREKFSTNKFSRNSSTNRYMCLCVDIYFRLKRGQS